MGLQECLMEINALLSDYEDDTGVLIPSKIEKKLMVNSLVAVSHGINCGAAGDDNIAHDIIDYLIILVEKGLK